MRTETLTTMDMGEFDELVETHLGIERKKWDSDQLEFVGDWDGIQGRELANGSYVRFYAEYVVKTLEEPRDWHDDATHYAAQLVQLGVLPGDQDTIVWIDW